MTSRHQRDGNHATSTLALLQRSASTLKGYRSWRVLALGAAFASILSGCAAKPPTQVAHGEDHNLFKKADLLGIVPGATASAYSLQAGKPVAMAKLAADVTTLTDAVVGSGVALSRGSGDPQVRFDISENYLTVSRVDGVTVVPVAQFEISGHYDLRPQTGADGVETQYLVRTTDANAKWQDREYVEVDPAAPLKIKADADTLRNLHAVSAMKDKEFVLGSLADLDWMAKSDRDELAKLFGLKKGQKLKTTLTRRRLTLLRLEGDVQVVLAHVAVRYVDLVRHETSEGELTPDLVQDTTKREWSRREYVEIDPEDVELAKPDADLLVNLVAKTEMVGKTFVYGKDLIPVVGKTEGLAKLMAASVTGPIAIGAEVELHVTQAAVEVVADGELVLRYPVLGHFDLVPVKDENGKATAGVTLDASERVWSKRAYVKVDPTDPEIVRVSEDLKESAHQILAKDAVSGKCFTVDALPLATLEAAVVQALGAAASDATETKICLEVTQTVLSVYVDGAAGKELLLTYDIVSHFDIAHAVSADGRETDATLSRSRAEPRWDRRGHLEIEAANPHAVESHVGPNALARRVFEGEFIYTATVVEAHSENGIVFEGWNLQSPDRLRFVSTEDAITAYKVNETLNDSGAKSPVLRYAADHFDITRAKNGYGDLTNDIVESHERSWKDRKNLRVDFANNQIPSYFNDLLGVEKLYSGIVFTARSTQIGELTVEDGYVSFDTEEVVTPNVRAGFEGSGETFYEPVAIKVRHAFMRVGKRPYVAKEYDGFDFRRFGYFRTTEAGIDPILGKTDATLKHFIRRFDVSNGKQVTFHLSPGFPETYKDEARKVIAAWNVAFKEAVGRDDVLLLDETTAFSHGDPRHSMIVFVEGRNDQSPLGFGPSFFDPATGENLSAKAYLYGDGIGYVKRMAGDFLDLAAGARHPFDFADERHDRDSMSGTGAGDIRRRASGPATFLPHGSGAAARLKRDMPKGAVMSYASALERAGKVGGMAPEALRSDASLELNGVARTASLGAKARAAVAGFDHLQGCVMRPDEHIASAIKFLEAHPEMTRDELIAEVESKTVFTTLLHEVGHTLGLRHNFHGSYDEANFPEEYHLLKAANDAGLPDPAAPGLWIMKYRTSSAMDYLDDFEGLFTAAGPYDVAAVKYGYGDKLEQVVGQTDEGAFVTQDIDRSVLESAKAELRAANPGAPEAAIDGAAMQELKVRPYRFCTDEHVENDPTCNRFDRGVSVTEITQSLVDDYDVIYWLYGHRRGKRMFTGGSDYVISRYILPVRQLFDEYVYNIIFDSFEAPDMPFGAPLAGSSGDYIDAINIGLRFYDSILNTIEPGDYHLDAATGELVPGRAAGEGAKNVVVDLLSGKYLKSRVESVGDEDRVLNRGVELDKLAVLWAMSLRGYPAYKYEQASLAMNYFDLLKEFTMERFSALVRDEHVIDVAAEMPEGSTDFFINQDPQFTADPANPAHLKAKIRPSTSLAVQQYAALFAMIGYDSESDRTFGDYVDVRVKGIDGALPEDVESTELRAANGARIYVVPNTVDKLSITYQIAQAAAPKAERLSWVRAGLAGRVDLVAERTEVIRLFAEAWEIGEGAPMGADIVDILTTSLVDNLAAVRGLTAMWIEGTEDAEAKAKLEALAAAMEPLIVKLEEDAATAAALATEEGTLVRDVTRAESQLIFLNNLYKALN
jgi:hypothetical protein